LCHKFYRVENYFIFEQVPYRKKFEPTDKELLYFLPKKSSQALKNMGWGSGIRKKTIPDPEVKKAPDPGSATLHIK
jgi:hypothetical protein